MFLRIKPNAGQSWRARLPVTSLSPHATGSQGALPLALWLCDARVSMGKEAATSHEVQWQEQFGLK